MPAEPAESIAAALGIGVRCVRGLSGGCIGDVYRVDLEDGSVCVAKVDEGSNASLDVEAYMLRYLAEQSSLPVPAVRHGSARLLVMDYIEGDSRFGQAEQRHAAELLAALHAVSAPAFGLERDTLIGGLHQPNPKMGSWRAFFGEHRLLYMASEANQAGSVSSQLLKRVGRFAEDLDRWISEPPHPSLLHGDVWTTNVLAQGGRITGFIDPAVYYGHPEIELAFTTLFGTFGNAFFERYNELRPIAPGFFEERKDIYNLYPLLVHARLFGSSYAMSVGQILTRHGY